MNGESTLPQRYAALLARIESACLVSDRAVGSVRLLAVSKTFGAAQIREAWDAGQRIFGENFVQESLDKMHELQDLAIEWHFIGPLQSNKTRPIAERFDWVQSVDREKIARRLAEQRPPDLAPLQVCLQVNVSGEASKSGCTPEEALALARVIATLPALRLRGVMAIPAPDDDPARQREQFSRVRSIYTDLQAAGFDLDTLSIGMSDDLESAIAEGSTMLRVGSALFGRRPPNPVAQ